MIYTNENAIKYKLWSQIIIEAKKVLALAGHDIKFVPEAGEYAIKSKSYEDLMF